MDYVISTEMLTKRFGKKEAVKDLNLHIRKGEIYGLIGKNGAGKTTLLKLLSGLLRPTRGSVSILGESFGDARLFGELRKIGALIENPGLYMNLSGYDNLKLKCIEAGIPNAKERVRELLSLVGLSEAAKKKCGAYSFGMKQRIGIAMALIDRPEILLLDEPINGMDPQGIVEVRELIQKLNAEQHITVIISSHILSELEQLVTTLGIIDNGMLLKEISKAEMEAQNEGAVLLKTDSAARAMAVLSPEFSRISAVDDNTLVIYGNTENTARIAALSVQNGLEVRELVKKTTSLEDYYLKITGGEKK